MQLAPGFERLGYRTAQTAEYHAIGHRMQQTSRQGADTGKGLERITGDGE